MACESVRDLYGEEGIVDPTPTTGGEDFSIFTEKKPGFFYWLGSGNPQKGCVNQWHSPKFKADTDCLIVGANVLAQSTVNYMFKYKK